MNNHDRDLLTGTVERELDEQTVATLFKYARFILKIHYLGLVHAVNGAMAKLALDSETSI